MTPSRGNADPRQEFFTHLLGWRDALNLRDWVFHLEGARPRGAAASVSFNVPGRMAVFRLGEYEGYSVDELALHEALHVLLHDLIAACRAPDSGDACIAGEEHRVINVLSDLLRGNGNA